MIPKVKFVGTRIWPPPPNRPPTYAERKTAFVGPTIRQIRLETGSGFAIKQRHRPAYPKKQSEYKTNSGDQ